jgi:glycosyltransferase involved in cell wall biosynthesis
MNPRIGVIVIGRNEGERLRVCLSAIPFGACDGSLDLAKRFGAHCVALDMSRPFTAARARNTGVRALAERLPEVEFVQFLDGDCELQPQWLGEGVAFLMQHPEVAVTCGRLRERDPQRSVFNRLCDWEWDAPPGDAKACGGNALMRLSAFQAAAGFREELIAGEEPELCVRLRRAGWRVHRLPAEMALHDAAMTRFTQWWRRTMRGGHAFAEGAWLHGMERERHWVRETLRAVFYGGVFPLSVLVLCAVVGPWALLLLLVYPVQVLRLARQRGGYTRAFYMVLARFPEFVGVMKFVASRLGSGPTRLIEHR